MDKKKFSGIAVVVIIAAVLVGSVFIISKKPQPSQVEDVIKNIAKRPLFTVTRQQLPKPTFTPKIVSANSVIIPILMYHHVGTYPANADGTRKDLTVPTSSFKQQVEWVASQGYTTISLQDLYLFSQGQFTLPKKPIVFTFDDGYADVFQNAVPILKQNNFMGSFAIITQWPGQIQGDNVYASWDDIASAQSQGMEIVCHTQNHFDGTNPKFDSNYIFQNLSGCKQDLSNHGITSSILIYPYGHYSADYITQAQKAGFVMGITTKEGDYFDSKDLMQLPRVRVHGDEDLQRFEDILLGKFFQTANSSSSTKPTAD